MRRGFCPRLDSWAASVPTVTVAASPILRSPSNLLDFALVHFRWPTCLVSVLDVVFWFKCCRWSTPWADLLFIAVLCFEELFLLQSFRWRHNESCEGVTRDSNTYGTSGNHGVIHCEFRILVELRKWFQTIREPMWPPHVHGFSVSKLKSELTMQ